MALVRGIGLLVLAVIAFRFAPSGIAVSASLLLGLLGIWQLLVGVFALLGVGKRL